MLHMQHEDCPSTFWGSRNAGADTTTDVDWAPENYGQLAVLLGRHRFEAAGGQSARDEFAEQRNLALLEQRDGLGGVGRHARLGGIPIHQRQVVVAGILGVGAKLLKDWPTLFNRGSLQGGCKV